MNNMSHSYGVFIPVSLECNRKTENSKHDEICFEISYRNDNSDGWTSVKKENDVLMKEGTTANFDCQIQIDRLPKYLMVHVWETDNNTDDQFPIIYINIDHPSGYNRPRITVNRGGDLRFSDEYIEQQIDDAHPGVADLQMQLIEIGPEDGRYTFRGYYCRWPTSERGTAAMTLSSEGNLNPLSIFTSSNHYFLGVLNGTTLYTLPAEQAGDITQWYAESATDNESGFVLKNKLHGTYIHENAMTSSKESATVFNLLPSTYNDNTSYFLVAKSGSLAFPSRTNAFVEWYAFPKHADGLSIRYEVIP